ncbi:hypothetical protein VNI00_018674 [Paramarasmius palmivorus]|uniref:Prolyl 4-hydroxylase alpha subunit Fe(2+) 2OG dioxygenase domain-containing protein n=1 Tax=Paramarasmius palmivorus TaxID=297713 RepID=A0AAW0AWF7_9AGAR
MDFDFVTRIPNTLKGLFVTQTEIHDQSSASIVAADRELDNLLLHALHIAENPSTETESPLTTPPDTPPSTPPNSPSLYTSAPFTDSADPTTLLLQLDEVPARQPHHYPHDSIFSEDPTSWPSSAHSTPPDDHASRHKQPQRSRRVNKTRDKLRSKLNRQAKRSMKSKTLCRDFQTIKSHQVHATVITQAQVMEPQFQDHHLPRGTTGYLGVERELPPRREYTYEELVGPKFRFRVHRHSPSNTCPLLHAPSQSVIGLVVPGPRNDPTWSQNIQDINSAIERLRSQCVFKAPRLTIPRVMAQDPKNAIVLEAIRTMKAFQRLAGFISVVFLSWAPKLFLYYAEITASLLARYPNLYLPFERCIFAAFTINFGPTTVCYPHRDIKNLAFGWCAITALGNYDWTKGGHLVLWDLKLIIEFPPGTTIFIPSALVCHLNTKVAPNERRYSFAMYSAGGLFRWVEHGYQAEQLYRKTVSAARAAADGAARWVSGFAMFSTLEELKNRAWSV